MFIYPAFRRFALRTPGGAAFLLAGLLGLGHGKALAQAAPKAGLQIQALSPGTTPTVRVTLDGPPHKGPYAPVYLDGKRISIDSLKLLTPDSIASTEVLKAATGEKITPDAAGLGLLVITSKQGQHQPAVLAFNERVRQLKALQNPTIANPALLVDTSLIANQPTGAEAEVSYYLNGQPVAKEAINQLDPATIDSIDILKGERAASYTHDPKSKGAVLIKTKP